MSQLKGGLINFPTDDLTQVYYRAPTLRQFQIKWESEQLAVGDGDF
jgi:hypothetical protein